MDISDIALIISQIFVVGGMVVKGEKVPLAIGANVWVIIMIIAWRAGV